MVALYSSLLTLIVCFSLLARAFWNFSWFGVRATQPVPQRLPSPVAFVADDMMILYARSYSSFSLIRLATFIFIFTLSLSLSLSLSTFTSLRCNFPPPLRPLYATAGSQASERTSNLKYEILSCIQNQFKLLSSRWPFLVYFARLIILLSSSAVLLRFFFVGLRPSLLPFRGETRDA